ncbi:MAG: YhdP family protein, partial [Halofilum sp. (in: g-proteobacteria)]
AVGAPDDAFDLRARFENAGWVASGAVPGAEGFDGRLTADEAGARIGLASRAARVDAPRVLAAPLTLDRAAGEVDVDRSGDGWRIRGEGLQLENADGRASGRIDAVVPDDGAVHLDIEAGFEDVAVPAVTRYLPYREIPDKVISGLERTLQDGRVTRGELRLRGRAHEFPYRDGEGLFTVDLDARDARIDFAPGWPALEAMSGRVRFDGPSLHIDAEQGRIFDIRSRRLTGRIPDLEEGRLAVSAESDAPVADLIRLVNESPLADELGRFFRGARGSGRTPFGLDLEVPLRAPEETTVAGRLDFDGDSLVQPRFDLDLRDLDGTLRFTRRGVAMDRVGATVRGQRLQLDARVEDGAEPDNVIEASGPIEPAALVPELAGALEGRVSGAAPWNIGIRIPSDDDAPIRLSGTSDLRGTRVDLPAPLRKSDDAARRLAFSLPLVEGAGERPLRLEYGDDLRALVELQEDADGDVVSERAAVHFGDGELRLRDEPGLYLSGTVDRLDLRGWAGSALAGAGIGQRGSGGDRDGGAAPGMPGFGGVDLEVGAAAYGDYVFSDALLRARREGDGWLLDLDSDEASGETRIPANVDAGEPIRVRYDWIDLGLLAPEATESDDADAANGERTGDDDAGGFDAIDPSSVPPLDIRIGRLKTRNGALNDVGVVTGSSAEGMTIHRLGFDNDALRLEGQGHWRADPRSRTALRLQFRSDDFGAGLAGIGYGGALLGGEGDITADLDWAGPPWAPALDDLGGHAQIRLEEGLIPEVDPGPARLLGLLSLRALPQLLSLDFSNLVQRGYAFDTVEGRIDFADGNAFSRGLEVDGPAGKIIITGRTGLIERDYD